MALSRTARIKILLVIDILFFLAELVVGELYSFLDFGLFLIYVIQVILSVPWHLFRTAFICSSAFHNDATRIRF